MFIRDTKNQCLDYVSKTTGETTKDVAPIFYVESIVRNVEQPNGLDSLRIRVNDHNMRDYTFDMTADKLHSTTLTADLCKNGVMIEPCWQFAVIKHLMYGYKECIKTQSIVYQNQVLGWYPFEGKKYYFYDETDFGNNHALTTRTEFEFQKGDKTKYFNFLKETVFPSTELSLALVIGYSAVVVSRLNDEYDLRNSHCKSMWNF